MRGQVSLEAMISFLAVLAFATLIVNSLSPILKQHFDAFEKIKCKNEVERGVLLLDSASLLCDNCEMKLDVNFSNGMVHCKTIEKKTITDVENLYGEISAK